ncbi:tetratricopeptide repeat protein [Planctomycetota bacterium]
MKSSRVICWFLIAILWGCAGGQSTKQKMHLSRNYNKVKLEELLEKPAMFASVPITFRCIMGQTGDVFLAMNTHFTDGNSINFGVWPENTNLWIDQEARDNYHPLVYIRKDSPIFPVFRDIKKYEVVDVFGDMRDTYAGQAWIEIVAIQRVRNEETEKYMNRFTDKSLFYIKNAIEYENEKEYDFAIEDFSRALNLNLPRSARVEILFKKGTLEAKQENYKDARVSLEACVEADKENKHYKAYALLGEVYRQLKTFDLAILNSKKALDIKPNYIAALRTYGISLALREKDPDYIEAERKARRALKFDTTDPETNYYLGIIYGLQKKYNTSIEFYKIAIDNLPQDFRYHKGLAGIYHKRSNVKGVDSKQAVNDKEISLHEYEIVNRILKRTNAEDPDVFYFSGVVQEELGVYYLTRDPKKARSYFDLAKANYEKCVSLDKTYKNCWYELAYRYIDDKEFKKATKVYEALAKMEPENAEIRVKKAVMLHDKLNDKPQALKSLNEALLLNSNSVNANYLSGRYLLETGWDYAKTKNEKKADESFKEAKSFLIKGLKLAGNKHLLALRDLVYTNNELGQAKDVMNNYENFAKVYAEDKQGISKIDLIKVYLDASNAFKSYKKEERAAELLNKSLKLDLKNADTHVALGIYYLEVAEDADKAVSHGRTAVELRPDWKSFDILGWALSKQGKNDEAIRDAYSKISKKDITQNPQVLFHIGMIQYYLEKYPQATQYLKLVISHSKYGREAKKTLREIERK